jgi:multicomponent Na+:H+ antiporter subunit E
MQKVKPGIILFLFLFGLWTVLAGTDRDELVVAGIASLLISILFAPRITALGNIRFTPKIIAFSVIYIYVFLRELVKSTLDVAGRVISPRLPINPGIVKVKTKLKSPLGRSILANSITLTPGTMTVETDGEYFYIHWIDIQAEDIDSSTQAIVATFEKYLEVIFG